MIVAVAIYIGITTCSLSNAYFVLITHSVYGVQCFLTENWGFVNVFLPTLDPSFLVVEDNRCNFAVYKEIHCKVKRQQHNYGKTDIRKYKNNNDKSAAYGKTYGFTWKNT